MKNNPVDWFEIYVQDMARAKRFYEAVFQSKLDKLVNPEIEMWGFPMNMERYGATGSLVHMEGNRATSSTGRAYDNNFHSLSFLMFPGFGPLVCSPYTITGTRATA